MSIFKSVDSLGIKIDTDLCKSCIYQNEACPDINVIYGSGYNTDTELPNICACSGYDPMLVSRSTPSVRRTDPEDFVTKLKYSVDKMERAKQYLKRLK